MATNQKRSSRVPALIGLTVLAIAAGYVGGLAGQQYINYLQQFVIPDQQIQRPRNTRTLGVSDVVNEITPSIATIYKVAPKDLSDSTVPLVTSQQYIGDAVAISADGWLVSPTAEFTLDKKETKDTTAFVAIYKQQVYKISTTVADKASGVTFFKLDGARLKPASFAWEQSVIGTTNAYVVSEHGDAVTQYITQPQYKTAQTVADYIQHTTDMAKRSNADLTTLTIGQPVATDTADIIGIVGANGIIPSYQFRDTLDQALTSAQIKRIGTDITYYDNAWLTHGQFQNPALPMSGATIIDPGTAKVLQKGDVIVHVNNEHVDINRSLSDILNEYAPGDTVRMGIQRAGSAMDISLTLK